MCAKLNILKNPMNIFNMDETGVTIVHKVEKVVTEIRHRNVLATSGEKGKPTHMCFCIGLFFPFLDLPKTDKNRKVTIAGTVTLDG